MTAHQIAPRPSSLERPARDKKYLKWIRQQPCVKCGRWFQPIEAAHTGNSGAGMSQKASDHDAIPLCADDHRMGSYSYHAFGDEAKWAGFHALDLPAIRKRLREQFEKRRAA